MDIHPPNSIIIKEYVIYVEPTYFLRTFNISLFILHNIHGKVIEVNNTVLIHSTDLNNIASHAVHFLVS